MNPQVNSIASRLSLRPPQRRSLEILDRITEIVPLRKDIDPTAALAAIRREFPGVTEFERDFPSVCFALATGVGKTRLMGAFISYLHLAHGLNNFFVLAPNLTIYTKLIADFTPNTAKYVFRGIAEFSVAPPIITTGENYERHVATGGLLWPTTINIFNISKINAEVRGGHSPRIRSFREEIGESYFDYLAGLDDLVLIMDESHRYRASAGVRAINDLDPVLGLELTATPFVESARGPVDFKNVIYSYPLGRAIADGFVKKPAVVTRENFDPSDMGADQIEELKLEDGIRLHENVRVELETYARQTGEKIVKPFVLVIAKDTSHASSLVERISRLFDGRYSDKVIQVDSSRTGAEEEAMVARLLKVEDADEPTEIVVHVDMLKEGWDVTNLYTIIPLRTADARTLVEQSIGRGLRLPYGGRTGVAAVDRLNIVAHDRFREIVDAANRPDSPVRVETMLLDGNLQPIRTIVSEPRLSRHLGLASDGHPGSASPAEFSEAERPIAAAVYAIARRFETQPDKLPGLSYLARPEIQAGILAEVGQQYGPEAAEATVQAVIARTTNLIIRETIDIPRILVVPKGEIRSGFRPFTLDLSGVNYPAPSEQLWIHHLATGEVETLGLSPTATQGRAGEYVVNDLIAFEDIAYDQQSALLYDLAGQVTAHLQSYLSDEDAARVLRLHHAEIARFIHAQMQDHRWEDEKTEYEARVTRGFTALRPSAYTVAVGSKPLDFRVSPPDKSNMGRYLFNGFARCLYDQQKFDSDAERQLAVILDRDSSKWFRPARGQFQIFYRRGADHPEYQPDFVAETPDRILMLEAKAANQMEDGEVLAKMAAAVAWCGHASDHARSYGGKPWTYVFIPHDAMAPNRTLADLVRQFARPR